MAKLKSHPKTYAEAVEVLNGRISMKLGNNTYLEVPPGQHDFVAVRLHSTYIVKFWADGQVTLHTGGWQTVTTKDRLNEFISQHIYQKDYVWYVVGHTPEGAYDWDNPVEFTEGMNVGGGL